MRRRRAADKLASSISLGNSQPFGGDQMHKKQEVGSYYNFNHQSAGPLSLYHEDIEQQMSLRINCLEAFNSGYLHESMDRNYNSTCFGSCFPSTP
jgi:hypothetical protein